MKKRIIKSTFLTALTGSLSLAILTTVASCSNSKNEVELIPQLPLEPSIPTIEKNESISRSPNINIFNKMEARIIKDDLQRNINSQVYETDLTREFQNKFKYPAWNFNY